VKFVADKPTQKPLPAFVEKVFLGWLLVQNTAASRSEAGAFGLKTGAFGLKTGVFRLGRVSLASSPTKKQTPRILKSQNSKEEFF